MASSAVKEITVYRLAIPMRGRVEHAAAVRDVAEPIVIKVELNSGAIGFGETLPRPYVTGETVDSAVAALGGAFVGSLLQFHPQLFASALEMIDALPWIDATGEPIPAARAGLELALLDAYSRHFDRPITDVCGWSGLNHFGAPGSIKRIRFSGVIATSKPRRAINLLRLLWWNGIRDFKLKVGYDGDQESVQAVAAYLKSAIYANKASLRVDANGGWRLNEAINRLKKWRNLGIDFVEQPLPKGSEVDLPELKGSIHQPVMYDESLVTMADAKRLVDMQVADGFNIRIAKCGGFLPSLKLADYAQKQGITIQLGCMVGETSILSAIGRRFLEIVPEIRFAEGSFGRFLLKRDVVRRPVQFGYGGKVPRVSAVSSCSAHGWGIDVDHECLEALSQNTIIYVL